MYGRPALARITGEITPWWYRFYRKRGMRRLQCEFRLLSGGICKTTVQTRGKIAAPDSEIVILYDSDRPEKAMLYPDRLLKVGNPGKISVRARRKRSPAQRNNSGSV
jgi:hypothetical protein